MPQNDKNKNNVFEKFDFVERVFVKLFGAASKDAKSAMLAVAFIIIGAMFWRNDQLADKLYACNEIRVIDKQEQYNEILRLLLPEIERKVDEKVEQKTEKMIEGVQKIGENVNKLTKTVKTKIDSITK